MKTEKQSNQQRVNELARKKGARVERFNGCHVHTKTGEILIAKTLDEAEAVLKTLDDAVDS